MLRPAIGQTNNGDFPRMAGPFGLGPEVEDWESQIPYGGFVYKYIRADRYLYNTRFQNANFLSSEYFFVKLARGIQRIVRPGPRFDIRWLGAVHILFFLIGVSIWMQVFPRVWKLGAGLLAVFIWTDAAYAQYMNTFYMDAAAIIFLVMCAAALIRAAQEPHSRIMPLMAVSAGVLFAASKTQNAIPGLLFVPLFLALALRVQPKVMRAVWIAGAILLPAGSYMVLSRATSLRGAALFNIIFMRVAPQSSHPLRTLRELGLGQDEMLHLNKNAFYPDSPMADPVWVVQFNSRTSYASLARYYVRHPQVPLRLLWHSLSAEAGAMRPFANLSSEDGFSPYSRTKKFAWWSDFRGFLFRRAPWHMVVFVTLVLLFAICILWFPGKREVGLVALTVPLLGFAEYAISVLMDAVDTARHLMLFHVATDISILLMPLMISMILPRAQLFRSAVKRNLSVATRTRETQVVTLSPTDAGAANRVP
jgi:hypothetical protein